jgi:hypothetical protein
MCRRHEKTRWALDAPFGHATMECDSQEQLTVILQDQQERCPSGRRGRPAKALYGLNRIEGSNPSLSARNENAPIVGRFHFWTKREGGRTLWFDQNALRFGTPRRSCAAVPTAGRDGWIAIRRDRHNPSLSARNSVPFQNLGSGLPLRPFVIGAEGILAGVRALQSLTEFKEPRGYKRGDGQDRYGNRKNCEEVKPGTG